MKIQMPKSKEPASTTYDAIETICNIGLAGWSRLTMGTPLYDDGRKGLDQLAKDTAIGVLENARQVFERVSSNTPIVLSKEEKESLEKRSVLTDDEIRELRLRGDSAADMISTIYFTMLKSCANLEELLAKNGNFEDVQTTQQYVGLLMVWDALRIGYIDQMKSYGEIIGEEDTAKLEARLAVPEGFMYGHTKLHTTFARVLLGTTGDFTTSRELQGTSDRRHMSREEIMRRRPENLGPIELTLRDYWADIFENGGSIVVKGRRIDNVKVDDIIDTRTGEIVKDPEETDPTGKNLYRVGMTNFVGGAFGAVRRSNFRDLSQARLASKLAQNLKEMDIGGESPNDEDETLSSSYVSAVERNQITPSIRMFYAFVKALDTPIEALLPARISE